MAKYSKGAQKNVESAMKRMEKGILRSGKSNKKVTNPKQAIAIGLSEAREKGAKVPAKKAGTNTNSKTTAGKAVTKKSAAKKAAPKKVAKSAKPVKAVSKKSPPVKAKTPAKKKKASAEKAPGTNKKRIASGNTAMKYTPVNDAPPVEEKSPAILQGKTEDPARAADKQLVAKLTSKVDPNHNMPLSSIPKGGIKPSGKKPLWRR